MVKILCIGDVHIQINNIPSINIFIKKLEDYLQLNKYDFVILLGDILHYHEKLYTVCLNKSNELFTIISKYSHCFVLVGNHDFISNNITGDNKHPFMFAKNMSNITIIDKPTLITSFPPYKFVMSSFLPDSTFVSTLNTELKDEWKTVNIVFAHQAFNGGKMGAIICDNGDDWDEKYPLVISGHFHDKQKVQKNLIYTGSCMQHAFGETHDKTLLHIDLKTNKRKEIDLELVKKKIIYIDDIKKLYTFTHTDPNVLIKLTISGSFEDFKSFKQTTKYTELKDANINMIFKYKKEEQKVITNVVVQKRSFKEILQDKLKNTKLEHIYNNL